jgi:invasion protein IalB
VADADGSADLWAKLKAVSSANVSFTALQGQKKIIVPVSLDGFTAAMAALEANGK